MSNMPRFDTEKVAPVYCAGCNRRARASSASSRASRPISLSDFTAASRMTGVIKPSSTATAIPRCTSFQ